MVIELKRGLSTTVDECDRKLIEQHKWFAHNNGKNIYVATNIKGKMVYLHRFITNAPKGLVVDHRDRNTLNNQKKNLRVCTQSENLHNTSAHKDSSTQIKGIRFIGETKKFVARITKDYKSYHLGSFETLQEAIDARHKAEVMLLGISYKIHPSVMLT